MAAFADGPDLSDQNLTRVADLRARGRSWDEAAASVEWESFDLQRACRGNPKFEALLAQIQRELVDDGQAEGLHRLRALVRDKNEKIALRAAEVLVKNAQQERECEARLEIERRRCEARVEVARLRAGAAGVKAEPEPEPHTELTDEDYARYEAVLWRSHEWHVKEALEGRIPSYPSARESEVWVFGGQHEFGGHAPGAGDTRVILRADHSVPGRVIVWALTAAQHMRLMSRLPSDPARAAPVPPDPPPGDAPA